MSSHHKDNKKEKNYGSYMMPNYFMMPAPTANQRLAEATVVYQTYGRIWDPMTALQAGTIFPDLYRPYEPETKL